MPSSEDNTTVNATAAAIAPAATDREAHFALFVAGHREQAVRLAWRLTGGDQATAEEVAQEAFLRAHRALDRFRGEAALSTWFYRILVRQAANHRRWAGVRQYWSGMFREDAPDPRPAPRRDPALRDRIAAAMDGLSPQQRSVFTLVHLEGFTVEETAEIVGCATGTAKSHLHRALKALRTELAPLREEGR